MPLSVGPNSPNSTSNIWRSGGKIHWSSTDAIKTSDSSYSTVVIDAANWASHLVGANDFGFAIPLTANILGIEVQVQQKRTAAFNDTINNRCIDDIIVLRHPSAGTSLDLSTGAIMFTDPESTRTIGGSTELWGKTWTPADINNTAFAVHIAATRSKGTSTAAINHVTVTVYYEETTAPTATVTLSAQAPTGPTEKPVTLSTTLTAQPPAIEKAPSLTLTLTAIEAKGPFERPPSLTIRLTPLDAIGPVERPGTNTLTLSVQDPIQPPEKLIATRGVGVSELHPDGLFPITIVVHISGIQPEELGQTNIVAATDNLVSPVAPSIIAQLAPLIIEPLEPFIVVGLTRTIGEQEIIVTTAHVGVAELLPSPLAATPIVHTTSALTHPLPSTFVVSVSKSLTETIELLVAAQLIHVAPVLTETPEPLAKTIAVAESSLEQPFITAIVTSVGDVLVELPGVPIPATIIVATPLRTDPLEASTVVAVGGVLVELPGVPLPATNVVATSSQDEPLAAAIVVSAGGVLVELPGVPSTATRVVGVVQPIVQPIASLTATIMVGVSNRLTETSEPLGSSLVVAGSSLEQPLITAIVVAAGGVLIQLRDVPIDATRIVAVAQPVVQPIEVQDTTVLVCASKRLTETIEPLDQTNVVIRSAEHGVGYFIQPVGVYITPGLGC
jgi:hypothetical protein